MYLGSFAKDQICFDARKLWRTPNHKRTLNSTRTESSERTEETRKPEETYSFDRQEITLTYRTSFDKGKSHIRLRAEIVPVKWFDSLSAGDNIKHKSSSAYQIKDKDTCVRRTFSKNPSSKKAFDADFNNNVSERYVWRLPAGRDERFDHIASKKQPISNRRRAENSILEIPVQRDSRSDAAYTFAKTTKLPSKRSVPEIKERRIDLRQLAVTHQPTPTTVNSLPLLHTNYYQDYLRYHGHSGKVSWSNRWQENGGNPVNARLRITQDRVKHSYKTSSRALEHPCRDLCLRCFGEPLACRSRSSDNNECYRAEPQIFHSDESSEDDGSSDTDIDDGPTRNDDVMTESGGCQPSDLDDSSGGDSDSTSCDEQCESFVTYNYEEEVIEQEEQTMTNYFGIGGEANSGPSDNESGPESFGDSEEIFLHESDEDSSHCYRLDELD